jgi:hypothetical protein
MSQPIRKQEGLVLREVPVIENMHELAGTRPSQPPGWNEDDLLARTKYLSSSDLPRKHLLPHPAQ